MARTQQTEDQDRDEKDDIETPEKDSTEEKAVEIGKKVDVATGEKEEIPDYDVVEEGSDKDAKTEDDKLAKDKRVTDDKPQRQELTNREKRQLKKKRIAEKFDAKDALIRQQQEQINTMAGRLNEVDGRLSSYDQAQFTQIWNSSVEAFNAAEKKHSEAFSAGDGAAATVAMREMYIAQKRIDELETLKARASAQPQRQQTPQAPDQRIVSKAQEWAKRNDWFKAGGADDDSAIADAIAVKLVKEGYDPKTDDYYEELDERLEKRGIGRREEEEDDEDEPVRRRESRRSPPVGGGSGRGDMGNGKTAVTLPTAFIQTLKDNGYWDDVPKRNKMIAGYLKGIKERGNA